jgi:energy-coupling factor transporter ATP-binding protein EcfA2
LRLSADPYVQDKPDAKPLVVGGGEIRFENVTFGYHPSRPIFKDCSFTIPAGLKTAIVGPSGCGKSTVFRLLFRFYEPQSGRILIDGQDIRDVTVESLRRAVGVVPQDTALFNGDIRENIKYGNLAASDEMVEEAAKRAKVDRIVRSLPDGYATKVGERGLMISGGEKQRLAIARLFLKNPDIIFLDEAVSREACCIPAPLTSGRPLRSTRSPRRRSCATSTPRSSRRSAPPSWVSAACPHRPPQAALTPTPRSRPSSAHHLGCRPHHRAARRRRRAAGHARRAARQANLALRRPLVVAEHSRYVSAHRRTAGTIGSLSSGSPGMGHGAGEGERGTEPTAAAEPAAEPTAGKAGAQ